VWLKRLVSGADPGAGVEISVGVAPGRLWVVYAVRFRLVADATVATRTVGITIDDGTTVFYEAVATPTQVAGETLDYTFSTAAFAQGTAARRGAGVLYSPCVMYRGWFLRTLTQNLQAGDNFGAPVLLVDELMEG
jgi:hypothetical protein